MFSQLSSLRCRGSSTDQIGERGSLCCCSLISYPPPAESPERRGKDSVDNLLVHQKWLQDCSSFPAQTSNGSNSNKHQANFSLWEFRPRAFLCELVSLATVSPLAHVTRVAVPLFLITSQNGGVVLQGSPLLRTTFFFVDPARCATRPA